MCALPVEADEGGFSITLMVTPCGRLFLCMVIIEHIWLFMQGRGMAEIVFAMKFLVGYNKISNRRGRIIVITGSPGTGKSTMASIIAKESNLEKSLHMHSVTDTIFAVKQKVAGGMALLS